MAEINYNTRKLELLSRDLIITSDAAALEVAIKSKLIDLIDVVKELHFEVIRADILLDSR